MRNQKGYATNDVLIALVCIAALIALILYIASKV